MGGRTNCRTRRKGDDAMSAPEAQEITEQDLLDGMWAGELDAFTLMLRGYAPQGGPVGLPAAFHEWRRAPARPSAPPSSQLESTKQQLLDDAASTWDPRCAATNLFEARVLLRQDLADLLKALAEFNATDPQDSTARVLLEIESIELFLRSIKRCLGMIQAEPSGVVH